MPIQTAEPPTDINEAARNTLGQQAEQRTFRLPALASAAPETLDLATPHPVYNLGLDDLAQRRGLGAAQQTGWRFLVTADTAIVATAEVAAGTASHAGQFSHFNSGPFVPATTETQARAEQLPEVKAGTYELRLLRVPALYVMALWLKDLRGHDDLLLPMAPAPAPLEATHTYTAEEFTELLAVPAQQRQLQEPPGR